jgi:hypothetical protein
MTEYATLEDVYPLIQAVGDLHDSPAAALITLVSAEIDGHLRARGYELPVTDSEALAFLTAVCASGTAARTLRSLFPSSEGVGGDQGAASAHEKTYQSGLDLIDKGGLGADMTPAGGGRVSHGFRDSAGTALASSTLVTRTTRETGF